MQGEKDQAARRAAEEAAQKQVEEAKAGKPAKELTKRQITQRLIDHLKSN